MSQILHRVSAACLAVVFLALGPILAGAQTRAGSSPLRGVPSVPPPDRPVVLYTAEQPRIRVVPVATGLDHPWGMAFRRNGDILVTERDRGTLRVIRNGQLLDDDVPGVPEVYTGVRLAGLMDVAVHPEDDTVVYLTYSQARERDGRRGATVALARGRLDPGAGALTEVRDIFVADGWGGGIAASRLQWGPDGTLYMSVGGAFQFAQTGHYAQDGATHFGKLLRLNDDGSVPDDNPFVDDPDHLSEIYSMGHRNQIGLAFHPDTGELWATEHGPQGGDEANIIRPGANYGWPIASYSRQYSGLPVTDTPWLPEFTGPEVIWWPSIAPSGLTFYDGAHFPAWRGNLFVGSMTVGRMQNTGHLERIVFNRQGQEVRREWLLTELKQRVREVQQGPDGYLYVLTEEDDGVLLRLEPAHAITEAPGSIVPVVRLTEARVPPLPESEWTAEQRALIEPYVADGHSNNVVRTLARIPALADRVLPFNRYVARDTTLSPRHRAILILRAAWLTQNGSIWATHASRAAEAGLTADEILSVAAGPDPNAGGDAFEETLLGLADQMFRNAAIADRTWDELAARYSTEEVVDAVMTVGDTIASAILFNTLGIQPDADTTARIPTEDVGYSVIVPDAEPPLSRPAHRPGRRRRTAGVADLPAPSGDGGGAQPEPPLHPGAGAVPADAARPGTRHPAHGLELGGGLRVGQARRQRRPCARPRPRPGLDRRGPRPAGVERHRAGAHRRRQRDVPRLDDLRRDVGGSGIGIRHAPVDEHRGDRGALPDGLDGAERIRSAAASQRRAVSGAAGVLRRAGRGAQPARFGATRDPTDRSGVAPRCETGYDEPSLLKESECDRLRGQNAPWSSARPWPLRPAALRGPPGRRNWVLGTPHRPSSCRAATTRPTGWRTTAERPSSWRGSPKRSPVVERPNASRCVRTATSSSRTTSPTSW